jgi:hypothetical protein
MDPTGLISSRNTSHAENKKRNGIPLRRPSQLPLTETQPRLSQFLRHGKGEEL